MMLRSSSTPVLGSLISPETPTTHNHHDTTPTPIKKLSFHHTLSPGSQHFTNLSCTSSPISPSVTNGGIRRAQSEGNLESLMISSSNINGDAHDDDDFSFFIPPNKFSSRLHSSLLETIPSFSFHNSRNRLEDDESSDNDDEQEEEEEEDEGFREFCGFEVENRVLGFNEQKRDGNLALKEVGQQMHLEKGLAVDAGFGGGNGGATGTGGGGNFSRLTHGGTGGGDGGGGDHRDTEEHYKKLVNENPGNPLFLRNYAQFLYQSKNDLQGAEEYYSRAILADANDGEILSQYAKLLWELHHDKEQATGYFERAIRAASEDSHVHAAYASFLWEIEEEDEEDTEGYYGNITPLFNNRALASATATA